MAPTAAALLALSVIYRLTINLPDLPYSYDLRKPGSTGFVETAGNISAAVDELLAPIRGEHRPVVFQFRFHREMGLLAYLDIFCDEERGEMEDKILTALHEGKIGKYVVSTEGYQLDIIREANDQCKPDEFQCSDGNCIPASQRCDENRDCPDGSDESKKFAECNHHQPVVYQTDKILSAPTGGQVLLSAMIDLLPENHRVVWRKGDQILGDGELRLVEDERIEIYKSENNYYLRIDNINEKDVGNYEVSVDGFTSKAHFEVRITSDALPSQTSDCPIGEKSCKSGHCIPVSQFCDRVTQCPDGDDEAHCSRVECTSSEIRCHSDNVCVPSNVACDGWNDCKDGSDEFGCQANKNLSHKAHGHHKTHSRLTVTCEDGSAPEYSLHGSSYCWSNSICPTGTACIQGLCCNVGPNSTLPRICPSSMYQCSDATCGMRCDGQADCPEGEDEKNCIGNEKRSVGCAAGEFACQDGSCIPEEKKCDRHYDCRDGSDETTCEYFLEVQRHHAALRDSSSTSTPEHQSQSGNHRQNGHDQHPAHPQLPQPPQTVDTLGEASEEADRPEYARHEIDDPNAQCSDQEFRCPYLRETRCVHYDKLCDGVDDCGDGSDEVNCESASREDAAEESSSTAELHGQCTANQFRCSNGRCIDKSLECNRKYDCDDGTDETSCDYFKQAMGRRNNEEETKQREEEVRRREEELRQREGEDARREQEERRREQDEREREQRQREHEERSRQMEEERRREEHERQLAEQRRQEQPDDRRRQEHERQLEEQRRREHDESETRRREEHARQQEEQRRREEQPDDHRRRQEHERQLEEQRRREEHEQRLREHQQRQPQQAQQRAFSNEVIFKEEYDDIEIGCSAHEFQCRTGECVDTRRVCDSRMDCLDGSDEANCGVERHAAIPPEQLQQQPTHRPHHHQQPQRDNDIDADGAQNVQITIYPTEAQVREGRDVTFDCRARTADNTVYPPVRWTRVGGPLPPHAHDSSGRLTINPTSLADAGRYVCTATHNGQTVEAHAFLNVQSYGPQELQGLMPSGSGQCMADEKQCGNNECVKSDYVCDGEPDCRDRSDEANCPALRSCEPNEFKCGNQRCVQKMWLCDGDDDCGDGSDEQNCGGQAPGGYCKKTEFSCADRQQCVPSSFHCDGTNDCRDGSDEVGCVQPTVVEPPETNKQVPAGSTFSLTCKAVAVPEAYINWRLNWGPVCEPPRCLQTSEGGFGTLTVQNAQPVDQGAYTCEAINVKGRVLATPDCIVRIVNIPAPPPPTAPPIRQQQPSCDPRGSVQVYPDQSGRCQCKPQVTGPNCNECRPGAFHLSDKSPQGCLKCFCFGITDQCRSSTYQRTKERLMFAGDSEGVTLSDMEERQVERNAPFEYFKTGYLTYAQPMQGSKFWRLPQRFLGNKVTAYGGKMEFEIEYSGSGSHSQEPMVVLKGNQLVLVHRVRNQEQVLQSDSPVRITVETYETSYEQLNGQPATREDLMMVLADLDAFMIRASHVSNQQSTR